MLKYNLCYIRQGQRILLLNRDYPGWMGCWNGVGGKLEPDESPRASMLREIQEETSLIDIEIQFKGLKTWSNVGGTGFGGLYLYVGYLAEDNLYPTPKKTDEGILDWKDMNWILNEENFGVVHNLPFSLRLAFENERCYDCHSIFDGNQLIQQISTEIDPRMESDRLIRERYLMKYLKHNA